MTTAVEGQGADGTNGQGTASNLGTDSRLSARQYCTGAGKREACDVGEAGRTAADARLSANEKQVRSRAELLDHVRCIDCVGNKLAASSQRSNMYGLSIAALKNTARFTFGPNECTYCESCGW
jgi:hypothetical protein